MCQITVILKGLFTIFLFLVRSHILSSNGVWYSWFWPEGPINAPNSIFWGFYFVPRDLDSRRHMGPRLGAQGTLTCGAGDLDSQRHGTRAMLITIQLENLTEWLPAQMALRLLSCFCFLEKLIVACFHLFQLCLDWCWWKIWRRWKVEYMEKLLQLIESTSRLCWSWLNKTKVFVSCIINMIRSIQFNQSIKFTQLM